MYSHSPLRLASCTLHQWCTKEAPRVTPKWLYQWCTKEAPEVAPKYMQ